MQLNVPVPFLGFIPTSKSVEIEEDRISTILNWCDVQSFFGFANFYR